MATIEEMALKTYPVNEIGAEDCSLDLAKIPRRAYIEGANAVLKEIETLVTDKKYIRYYSHISFVDVDKLLEDLNTKIEQLKKVE